MIRQLLTAVLTENLSGYLLSHSAPIISSSTADNHREPLSLMIVNPELGDHQLGAQGTVLGDQVFDHAALLLAESNDRRHEKMPRAKVVVTS